MALKNRNTGPSHHIVIVGGGAGGLELATRLGDTLGKHNKAIVTLVDKSPTHLWKPLLHEVAAGSMDLDEHELEYMAQARWHHFRFRLGAMEGLNRAMREIYLAPSYDDDGELLIPRRTMRYDTLVMALGSVSNDFGVPGVAEHCISLDTQAEAATFHRRLINACIRAQVQETNLRQGQLNVAIIGAGATGVELAAELHNTTRELAAYGLDRIEPDRDVKLSIIEAAPRVLPALPEGLSLEVQRQLTKLNISLELGERVTKVDDKGVYTQSGRLVPAELVVWAAGIKAPDFLKNIDGLETNNANQLVVRSTLQTTRDDNIFAMGDCAACPLGEGQTGLVPPRAQAAHQQASMLIKSINNRMKGKALPEYKYRDFGSLVNLGKYTTVGNLMGGITGGSLFIQGTFAGIMYRSLYKMHLYALHGLSKVVLDTIARMITRRTEPHVKLH
ncbi:NADH dehydrogenase [Novimethylophilus kurashikiensis]|uniref:NADH dehydrogenase n=1 Tax=Novimethylophilus kurashikiensis TaxID=1825523 RepID=A0A2R5FF41_9PROT|nr:NAD(P)/FAD-dependent oxidoreductase [Novimethylophilus kurashikiensis]GBG15303.1 NADH dehydrogenase [Novimethylophilus kurashikiensis]